MIQTYETIEAVQRRLTHGKGYFTLQDAVDALQTSYWEDRVCEDEDDTLIIVAGKFGKRHQARFEVALYRCFGLFRQLEISLKYPVRLRHVFFKTAIGYCDSLVDADAFFNQVRSFSWFRRYAQRSPVECSVLWRGEAEMSEIFTDLLPKMVKAIGSDCSEVCKAP
jgi:hypothetical protein